MADFRSHVRAAREAIAEARRHRDDALDAHDAGDDKTLRACHARLLRALRTADAHLRAAQDGIPGATSTGPATVPGTSSSAAGRSPHSPLMHGDISGWLDRARVGARS